MLILPFYELFVIAERSMTSQELRMPRTMSLLFVSMFLMFNTISIYLLLFGLNPISVNEKVGLAVLVLIIFTTLNYIYSLKRIDSLYETYLKRSASVRMLYRSIALLYSIGSIIAVLFIRFSILT